MSSHYTLRTGPAGRPRRPRKLAAAIGSLGLVAALGLSGLIGGGVDETEAVWTDEEKATASISASWMNRGYARVDQTSWTLNKQGAPNDRPRTGNGSPHLFTSTVSQASNPSTIIQNSTSSPGIIPPRENSNDIWLGGYTGSGLIPRNPAVVNYCADYPNPQTFGASATCGGTVTASRIAGKQTITESALSITGEITRRARINVGGASTQVRCFADDTTPTAEITPPSTFVTARETSVYSNGYNTRAEIPTDQIVDSPSNPNDGFLTDSSGQKLWLRANIGSTAFPESERTFVLFISPRFNTYVAPEGNYALAEIDLEIQVYSADAVTVFNDGGYYRGSVNYVLSRSECGTGVANQSPPAQVGAFYGQSNQPSWTPPLFSGVLTDALSGTFLPPDPQQVPARVSSEPAELNDQQLRQRRNGLDPATTLTSPTEHTIASGTTTSAPPNPDDADESTSSTRTTRTNTSTSAAGKSTKSSTSTKVPTTSSTATSTTAPTTVSTPPAGPTTTETSMTQPEIAIPDEPGKLSATAQSEDAGTADLDGEEFVVVVKGDELPADAEQGARALEIWLGGGNPGSTWETFASDDPDEDGWRWAAINQKTGTVVYIR